MLFNIPQFLDKEDKIVGPLTAKQLGWLFGGGTILLVLWNLLDMSAFIVAGIVVMAIFGAFAFYKPNGQTMLSFVVSSILFITKPKIYLWKRVPEKKTAKKVMLSTNKNAIIKTESKEISNKKISEIAELLSKESNINKHLQ